MAEVTLAKRFRTLAEDVNNRPIVARRGTLPSLMKFLQHADWEVRHIAAETVLMLAQHPENPEYLCREPNFVKTVYDCYKTAEVEDPELFAIFERIFNELRHVLANAEDGSAVPEQQESIAGSAVDHMASVRVAKNRGTRVRQGAAVSRSLVLQVDNLSPATHDELEHLLQTIRGIVSYHIDSTAKQVRVFLSTQTSVVVMVLTDGGFTVSVVADEVVTKGQNESGAESSAGGQPSYSSSVKDGLNNVKAFLGFDWRRTLVLHGLEGNSLQARLDRQKEEQARKYKDDKGAIANLFGKLKSWW